jgi:hypothetical protein
MLIADGNIAITESISFYPAFDLWDLIKLRYEVWKVSRKPLNYLSINILEEFYQIVGDMENE